MKKKYTKRNKRKNTNKKYTKRKSKRSSKKRKTKTKKIMRGGADYNPDTALSGWMMGEEKETPQPQRVFIRPIKLKADTHNNPNIGLTTDVSRYQYRRMDMSNFLDFEGSESISAIDELYDCPGLQSRIEGGTGTHTEILPQVLSVVGHASYSGTTLSLIPEELTLYLPVGDKENFITRRYSQHTTFEEKTTNDLRSYKGVVLNYDIDYDLNYFTQERKPLIELNATQYAPSGILLKELPKLENSESLFSQIMNKLVRGRVKYMSMSDFSACKGVSENEDGIKQAIHRTGDPGCNDYLNMLTSEHESEFYKTEEKDGKKVLKEMIDKQATVDLASVLKEINDVRERIPGYPSKVFGLFCRSGGLSGLVMKAMFVGNNYSDELPMLTLDYFKGNVKHIGADNLTRLSSLSSKSKFRDIWNILRKIQINESMLFSYLSEILKLKLEGLLDKIYNRRELELTIDELRFIFQIDYFLLLNPNLNKVINAEVVTYTSGEERLSIGTIPLWDYENINIRDLKELIKNKALAERKMIIAEDINNLRLIYRTVRQDTEILKDIDFPRKVLFLLR